MSMLRNMEHVKQTQFDLLELTNTMFEMKKKMRWIGVRANQTLQKKQLQNFKKNYLI